MWCRAFLRFSARRIFRGLFLAPDIDRNRDPGGKADQKADDGFAKTARNHGTADRADSNEYAARLGVGRAIGNVGHNSGLALVMRGDQCESRRVRTVPKGLQAVGEALAMRGRCVVSRGYLPLMPNARPHLCRRNAY